MIIYDIIYIFLNILKINYILLTILIINILYNNNFKFEYIVVLIIIIDNQTRLNINSKLKESFKSDNKRIKIKLKNQDIKNFV